MHPAARKLLDSGYKQEACFTHNELIPFILRWLKRRNVITFGWLVLTVCFFTGWLFVTLRGWQAGAFTWYSLMFWNAVGLCSTFVLIPVHEGLHGLAYKLCGAGTVTYKANWKQLYFMAIADGFVASRHVFYLVGSAPLVVITLLYATLALVVPSGWELAMLAGAWLHATMCAGDIGLMSYFAEHPGADLVTVDDASESLVYFFERPQPLQG